MNKEFQQFSLHKCNTYCTVNTYLRTRPTYPALHSLRRAAGLSITPAPRSTSTSPN